MVIGVAVTEAIIMGMDITVEVEVMEMVDPPVYKILFACGVVGKFAVQMIFWIPEDIRRQFGEVFKKRYAFRNIHVLFDMYFVQIR